MNDIKERCEEKSKDLVAGFLGLFGKEGKIVSTILHIFVDLRARAWRVLVVHSLQTSRHFLSYRVSSFKTRRRKLRERSDLLSRMEEQVGVAAQRPPDGNHRPEITKTEIAKNPRETD